MEYIQDLIQYAKVHPYLFCCMVLIFIAIIVLLYIYRSTKTVIDIVGNAIIEVEKEYNSEKGQQKLDKAVLIIRGKLPKLLSIFITKSMLVSIIEFMLNILGKAFHVDKKVDIKGNE